MLPVKPGQEKKQDKIIHSATSFQIMKVNEIPSIWSFIRNTQAFSFLPQYTFT